MVDRQLPTKCGFDVCNGLRQVGVNRRTMGDGRPHNDTSSVDSHAELKKMRVPLGVCNFQKKKSKKNFFFKIKIELKLSLVC